MSDIVVPSDNGVNTIVGVGPPVNVSIGVGLPTPVVIGGAFRGETGATGPQGPTGSQGPTGPTGPTGGIVPITVSLTPPANPSVNDLWINIS